jgi:alkanesulfonate monooxygenase SsuD/methylene tetrahydromethanopterin reductase-like flavin-dependent oxidoreductase (luciferase family)
LRIGIGLPNAVPETAGGALIEWARRAEERGFSTLGTIDRIAFPTYESLVALAAAGAVTERIGLMTDILLAPTRNPVLLAKEAASVDQVSGGRLSLGLAVGGRPDDYAAVGRSFDGRGRMFDEALEVIHRVWKGELIGEAQNPIGPAPADGNAVRVLIGGSSDPAIRRTVRWGAGWTAGGAPPDMIGGFVERIRGAWSAAGRDGQPHNVALTYFGIADAETAGAYIKRYYAFLGPMADQIAAGVRRTADDLLAAVEGFSEVGMDELLFFPTINDPEQVDLLADIVLV